jgi:hypothetical protein
MDLAQFFLALTTVNATTVPFGACRDQVDPSHCRVGVRERQLVTWYSAWQAGLGDE